MGRFGSLSPALARLNRVRHGRDGGFLAYDSLVQPVLHVEQPLRLALQQPVDRDARPARDQARDVVGVDHHVVFSFGQPFALPPVLVPQADSLGAELGRPLVVAALGGRLFLVLQVPQAQLHVLQAARHALGLDPNPAGGLVDQVYGLVRKQPLRDVPLAQANGGLDSPVGDGDLVVRLVPGPQPLEHLDGGFGVGLLDEDGLEPPLQGGVPLDVLPVLVLRGSAQRLQLAAGQRRLHHVAGVDGALGRARPDDGVQLVDEQYDLAPGLSYLVQDTLQALLELAAKLAARDHGADVQRENPPAAKLLRHVPGDDALRQPFGDGGLAHAGAADEHRVVLGPADQRLHRPRDLRVAADHRVQLPLAGQFGQVYAEPVERPVAAFRAFVGHPMVPADGLQRLVDLLEVDAELGQHPGGVAVVSLNDRHQQVLRADEVVAEPLRLLVCPLERLRGSRRHEDLRRLVGHFGRGFEQFVEP